jgi:hypothetical protein
MLRAALFAHSRRAAVAGSSCPWISVSLGGDIRGRAILALSCVPRREAMFRALVTSSILAATLAEAEAIRVGEPLPAWTKGTLEIHQLSTGAGNAALIRVPEGGARYEVVVLDEASLETPTVRAVYAFESR